MLLKVNVGEQVRISAGRETLWSLAIGRYGIKHGSRDQFRFTRRLYTGKVTVTQRFDYLKGTFDLLHLRRNLKIHPSQRHLLTSLNVTSLTWFNETWYRVIFRINLILLRNIDLNGTLRQSPQYCETFHFLMKERRHRSKFRSFVDKWVTMEGAFFGARHSQLFDFEDVRLGSSAVGLVALKKGDEHLNSLSNSEGELSRNAAALTAKLPTTLALVLNHLPTRSIRRTHILQYKRDLKAFPFNSQSRLLSSKSIY